MLSWSFGVSVSVLLLSIIASYIFVMNTICTVTPMANTGLLFVSNIAKVHNVCSNACKFVRKVLYVRVTGTTDGMLPLLSKQIVNIYSRASSQCSNLDVRLMLKPVDTSSVAKTNYPVDIILYESELSKDISKLSDTVCGHRKDCDVKDIGNLESLSEDSKLVPVKTYEYVALGGTFDRLHNGHKILLSQAVLRATKHITVGVTDVNMIQSKTLCELIQPIEQRIAAVLNFLTDINPNLEYNVLPIQDVYGPTKHDPRIQMLVVSEETSRGAVKVNEKRKENGLQPLEVYTIELAEDSSDGKPEEEEKKVSSSNQRMRLLGTILKAPVPNPNIPDWPYVIGLAGNIASGKSSIAQKLLAKGAAIVNCDVIGHELYKPGLPLNGTIAKEFGSNIITSSGEVDRKKLGEIVFSDKSKMEKLNQLLWPAIIAEADSRVRALGEQGYRVVVIEAAVLVRAKWYGHCHQLWSTIIPPAEAVKRLQKRNNLTEAEARSRLDSQPSNEEQIAHANVVFSTLWSYEFTQQQVDKAWTALEELLNNRS